MRHFENLPQRASNTSRRTALSIVLVGLVILSISLAPGQAFAGTKGASVWNAVWSAPQEEVPAWLQPVDSASQLYTEYEFAALAGKLINYGMVDGSACVNSGLLDTGEASDCGIQAALPVMYAWQNRFNSPIIAAAQANEVPARMIKNIFAWESQFWPTTVYVNTFEYGLGHITQMGADSALRWDSKLYLEVCQASFNADVCDKDFVDQPDSIRKALQGVILQKASADCPTCRFNIDFEKAESSIAIFARTLKANARFVEKSVNLLTRKNASDLLSEEDYWRFTLVSYNAGPGCFHSAAGAAYNRGLPLTWNNVKQYLEPACKGSIPYVNFVQNTDEYYPDHDPSLLPSPTAGPEQTETPAPTETPVVVDAPHSGDEIVLKIDASNPEPALQTLQALGINLDQKVDEVALLGSYVVEVASEALPEVLAKLSQEPGIVYAEPNYLVDMAGAPDDPEYGKQTNLAAIQVPQAWDSIAGGGAEVLVAVVDTGVEREHPELAGRLWTNPGETGTDAGGHDMRFNGLDDDANGYIDDWQGWNMVAGTNDVSDDQGHGTHLAGIIGAAVNNATGIAGIAPNARILPVKVLDKDGRGTHAQLAEGIIYAANLGAKVINLGLGGAGSSEMLQSAVNFALAKGAVIVASAGNTGTSSTLYPAGYSGVLAIAAVDAAGAPATFSTQGSHISLAAPGLDIYSTALGGGYRYANGTSMAAAHVSGVAALLAGQPQFADVDLLRSALLKGALDLGATGQDAVFGYGLVQAYTSLTYNGPILPTPTPVVVPPSPPDGVTQMEQQVMWAAGQTCTGTLTNPDNSIIPPSPDAFDGVYASCAGAMANTTGWTVTLFDPTNITLPAIYSTSLGIRFYMTGWVDDNYSLQMCTAVALDCEEDPGNWVTLEAFGATKPPPSAAPASTRTYNVSGFLTLANEHNLQVRLAGDGSVGAVDSVTMFFDQVSATFTGNTVPGVSITSPANGATFPKGTNITFRGTASDAEDGVISSRIQWNSNINGPLGTGSSRSTNSLSAGTHTIRATVYDNAGSSASTTITITVVSEIGPHGDYLAFDDGCATCHDSHSEQGTNSSVSANHSNDLCLSCHQGDNITVSTHANLDSHDGEEGNSREQPFSMLCIQCHNPHGGTGNLFNIRTMVKPGEPPMTYSGIVATSGPVTFTAMTGADSFDEVDAPENAANNADDICVTCHVNPANPGFPTSSHPGGSGHIGGDYTGVSCIICHQHSFDDAAGSEDGFMPTRGACNACHDTEPVVLSPAMAAAGDVSGDVHHVLNTATERGCELCHDLSSHTDGFTRLFNVNNPEVVYTIDGKNDVTEYQEFCLACHNFDKSSGETSPFGGFLDVSIVPATVGPKSAQSTFNAGVEHYAGDCRACHASGHGFTPQVGVLPQVQQHNLAIGQ